MNITDNKKFWTVDDEGQFVLRDLEWEAKNWFDRRNGVFDESKASSHDPYNSCWFEIFDFYEGESNGCDYERFGCQIQEGDVVADIGGNVGIFAHRAETRGASAVYSFEPMTSTFIALSMNAGPKTRIIKNAVYSDQRMIKMSVPDKKSNTGGGIISDKLDLMNREHAVEEFVPTISINSLFEPNMIGKIDFMKMDIEGAEVDCLRAITDENLSSLRCFAAEFHRNIPGVDEFREDFLARCQRLGFSHYTMFYQGGTQMTVNVWKH